MPRKLNNELKETEKALEHAYGKLTAIPFETDDPEQKREREKRQKSVDALYNKWKNLIALGAEAPKKKKAKS